MNIKPHLAIRLAAERSEALGNVSQGAKTGAEQLAYIASLPPAPKVLTEADAAADLAGTPRPDNPSAGVSAAEKAAVLDLDPYAEAKAAFADGELEFNGGTVSEPDWNPWKGKAPRWNSPVESYRRKPAAPAVPVDPYQHLREALKAGRRVQFYHREEKEWHPLPDPRPERRFSAHNTYRIAGEAA